MIHLLKKNKKKKTKKKTKKIKMIKKINKGKKMNQKQIQNFIKQIILKKEKELI